MSLYGIYRSKAFAVTRHPEGVEIMAWGSPHRPTVWLQGDEADSLEEDLNKNYHEDLTDSMLSEYFTNAETKDDS